MPYKKKEEPTQKKEQAAVSPQPLAADPIYGLGQAAQVLNLEERAVARKFTAGEIHAVKKHGRWYTTHRHIVAYLGL